MVGPWDHMGTHFGEGAVGELVFGPEATVPLAELRRDWLRHILHGAPAPELLRDRVMLYLAGAERWISAPSLEAATTGRVTRYLRSADGPMDATHSGYVEDAPDAARTPSSRATRSTCAPTKWSCSRGRPAADPSRRSTASR